MTKLEQMQREIEAKFGDARMFDYEDKIEVINQIVTEVWNEAIKECEGRNLTK